MGTLAKHRLAALVPIAAVIALLPLFFSSAYYYRVAALVLIFALAATGLNLLMGFAGQVSLGHAGFLGIGGYAVAIGPTYLGLSPWLCVVLGAAGCGALAFVVGRPILQLKGHYLAIATLGFGLLISIALTN
jgi:branched-chain amino acid transport system permease protein